MFGKRKKYLLFSLDLRKNINNKTVTKTVCSQNLFPTFFRVFSRSNPTNEFA
jgi:hypothetical protein